MKKFSELTPAQRQKLPKLSHIEGTITKVVEENSTMITSVFEDKNITDEEFKAFIFEILNKANQTPYVKEQKNKLEYMNDRKEIVFWVYNMALAGDQLNRI